jgi:glutamate dehydrogenase
MLPSSARADKKKANLIDAIVALVREKIPEPAASQVEPFVRQYYARVATEDLVEGDVADLYGAAIAHWDLLRKRAPGAHMIRIYNPNLQEHGWRSTHTIIETVTDDRPFLVDSISMALNRRGFTLHLIIHPIVRLKRNAQGALLQLFEEGDDPANEGMLESLIHAEVDRETDPELLDALRADLRGVLEDVQSAVEDWPKMRERVGLAISDLEAHPPPQQAGDIDEVKAFLRWIEVENFTFLGYRDYELIKHNGEDVLRIVPGSDLGILRDRGPRPVSSSFAELPAEVKRLARDPDPLILTKSSSRATVHRSAYLDYIGIKRFDAEAHVIGERRWLGLYTSSAYQSSPRAIPLLRQKLNRILTRSGLVPNSHSGKALLFILETYPRDELFQASEDELYETALGILHLQERQRVRLFVRADPYGRFLSCLVFVPRDRYHTELRERMQAIFRTTFNAEEMDFTVALSEAALARIHFIIHTRPGSLPEYDTRALEAQLVEASRSWQDKLHEALLEAHGEELGNDLFRRYREAFPAAYREDYTVRDAVYDIDRIEAALRGQRLEMNLYWPLEEIAGDVLRFKLYHPGASIILSTVLPMLENMGVTVMDDRPYAIEPMGMLPLWIHDFGLKHTEKSDLLNADALRPLVFQDAFAQVWEGTVENDGFNRLVLSANLNARAIVVLRAYAKYLRQTGSTFSQAYMEQALAHHPRIAERLIELFHARFDPKREGHAEAVSRLSAEIEGALAGVASLDEDRILRSFLGVIQASLRTNYFQLDSQGSPKSYLALKLDPALIPQLPKPRPRYEIFVYSARVEGVHLRGGKVARGGIRWSDRKEDFRTEVLGLMKAQMVKNAVIVPVGAKGGFVVKRPSANGEAMRQEGIACYQIFIRGLLDLTDNRLGDSVVPPPDVIRYEGDDPYLVVAADKGTASFSDIANAIAREYGFWLGDAFASGGSAGYDHKQMGITARGAWECVRHHFRGLGLDIQIQDLTVVGIGDMGGDVFGNGMLQSEHIRLIGAFNHQHIFLDPTPDPKASYAERRRLFERPGTRWTDYNPGLISPGGGVYSRTLKSIPISLEVKQTLAINADTLTPAELIQALLRAPVDLLWNGGIGTFIKATVETHADVGDRSNDGIRVNASELRCRVIGEGGNLGVTQRGRIEYALMGGRLNTDAIDNSGGVDCSDREVNLKIPLNAAVAKGDLTEKQRNALLKEMRDEVAGRVIQDNYRQAWAISVAERESELHFDWYWRFIVSLERKEVLDRALEALPDDEALSERRAARKGLTRPELACLLAFAKLSLYPQILASNLPDDPYLSTVLERYFPAPLRQRFANEIQEHRLRREIIATIATNSLVNRAGITFAQRMQDQSGLDIPTIARAYMSARDVFALRDLWSAIDAVEDRIAQRVGVAMILETQRMLEQATRWFLRRRHHYSEIAATVKCFAPAVAAMAASLSQWVVGLERSVIEESVRHYQEQGVPTALAAHIVGLDALVCTLDLSEIAPTVGLELMPLATAYFQLGERLDLYWLRRQIAKLPAENQWQERVRMDLAEQVLEFQKGLTATVLKAYTGTVETGIDIWLDKHRDTVERYRAILAELKSSGAPDLAMLTVALGTIRGVLDVG